MARFTIDEFDDLKDIPISVIDDMLMAEAGIVAEEQRKNAASMLNEKGQSKGVTAKSVKINSPKTDKDGSRYVTITFGGTRANGPNKKKRNAEVAFINEYGSSKMSARQFIRLANESAADRAVEAAAGVYDKRLET